MIARARFARAKSNNTLEARNRFDLGLEVAMCHAQRGVPMSQTSIAAFCGVSAGAIQMMESRTLRKLRCWHASRLKKELR